MVAIKLEIKKKDLINQRAGVPQKYWLLLVKTLEFILNFLITTSLRYFLNHNYDKFNNYIKK